MPSRIDFTYKTYIEFGLYIALLFFVIPIQIDNDYEAFVDYLQDFNKSYPDENMFNSRLATFKKSLEIINLLNTNRTNTSAHYGLTKYSDLTPEEFMAFHNSRPNGSNILTGKNDLSKRSLKGQKNIPSKVDWRDKHVVSSVKYQRDCGACWAFAVVHTIESMWAIKTHNLTELSIQQMIDCSGYNNGCQGGDTCTLLHWIEDFNITIAKETEYPLILKDQECKDINITDGVHVEAYICKSFIDKENNILKLLANGPVAVGVSAQTWQHYIGGVIQYHCDGPLSHAVEVVGYDLTAQVPHYIVRNSWGEDFGDKGYLYVAIGDNVCGIASEVAAVTVL